MRVLVGGVGYRNLRDHSIGVVMSDLLMEKAHPAGVLVEDASYNPIAFVQRLETGPVDRLILIGGVGRGREPGATFAYRWDSELPDAERIQAAVAEAVTGVIALDNTLMVGGHFKAFPEDVVVVEVEPEVEEFGDEFSAVVARNFDQVCDFVSRLASEKGAGDALPRVPLGALGAARIV